MITPGEVGPVECVCGLDDAPRTGKAHRSVRASRSALSDEAETDDHRARPRASVPLSELRIPVKPTPLAATELTAVRIGDERTVAPRTSPGCVGEMPAVLRGTHSPILGGLLLCVCQGICFRHDAT